MSLRNVAIETRSTEKSNGETRALCVYAEAVLRTMHDALIVLSADLRVILANEAYYKAFQATPDQVEGRLLYDLDDGHWDIPELRMLLEDVLQRNSFFNGFEVTRDRRVMLLHARRLELRPTGPSDEARENGTILLTIEDATDRNRVHTAAAALAAIVNSSDDAIIGKDLNGIISTWNQSAERLFGYSAHEAIGQPVTLLIPPERQHEEPVILNRIKHGERVEHFETVRVCKDGSLLDVSLTISPIKDATGRIVGASKILRNITERKRTEEALAAARSELAERANKLEQVVARRTAELREANKHLEAFVYSIAHDLRRPVRAMQGYAHVLLDEYGPILDETGRGYATRIRQAALSMDQLLLDLLDFSRLSLQAMPLHNVPVHDAVETVLRECEAEIRERQAHVEVISPLPSVRAYAPALHQVLVNLLTNAMKFVAPGVRPNIRIRAEENGEVVRVWVEDNGIGIASEFRQAVFDVFKRLHRSAYPGTGIGLAIVREGMTRMGGRAGVESAPGEGSRFWIELDQALQEESAPRRE